MTTEKHDPWALLAEIHELQPWLSQDADLAARVEVALASRDKPPCSCGQPYPCMKGCPDCCHSQGYLDYCQGDRHTERQDSAKDVVESEEVASPEVRWWSVSEHGAEIEQVRLRVCCANDYDWDWTVWKQLPSYQRKSGKCATEAEAKSAAIAAARGMR